MHLDEVLEEAQAADQAASHPVVVEREGPCLVSWMDKRVSQRSFVTETNHSPIWIKHATSFVFAS